MWFIKYPLKYRFLVFRVVRGRSVPSKVTCCGRYAAYHMPHMQSDWCFSYDLDSQLNSYLKLIFEVYRINISLWLFFISSGKGLSTHLDFWNAWLLMERIKKTSRMFNPYCFRKVKSSLILYIIIYDIIYDI